MKSNYLVAVIIGISFNGLTAYSQKIEVLETPPTTNIVASYLKYDTGGNTSVAFDTDNAFKWSGESAYKSGGFGYFTADGKEIPYIKRDRDLGQTFQVESDKSVRLKSITLKLGYGSNVVRKNAYGNAISLQIYEVKGSPKFNDNGSPEGTEAFHGYPHNRPADEIASDRDDFITGESYKSLGIIRGYKFPQISDFGVTGNAIDPDDKVLKGKLIRLTIPEKYQLAFAPEKTYAFMIMLDEPCEDCGFTLANNYYGEYENGHGMRRGGNGVFPPATANPMADFTHKSNKAAMRSAHFPTNFNKRIKIKPGTNGYPDVCTYRDLFFMVEAE